jgi:hypothetical protein
MSFLVILLFEARAQCNDERDSEGLSWDYDGGENEEFPLSTFLSEILTPQIIIDTKRIREYIIDERFQILRNRCGDMRTIDAIYLRSLKIADYNIARALFLSLMAVLEHRNVNIKIPIVNSIRVPLTFEEDSIFDVRIRHLPSRVYKDTLNASKGDLDKLQHFFGSAYLTYSSEAPELARTLGNLIEWGEAKFVVGGSDDPRDKRANKQGESYGRDLLVVKTLLPSDYLTFSHEDSK